MNAGTTQITTVYVEITSGLALDPRSYIAWSGVLAPGKQLIIDGRSKTVLNDGADAYSGVELQSSHVSDWWFDLASGWNRVNIARIGGNDGTATIQFDFAYEWN